MKKDIINVCYAISDKNGGYTKIVGTSICSLLENTSAKVAIYIIEDGTISEYNRNCLRSLVVEKYKQEIKFVNIDSECIKKMDVIKRNVPGLEESRLTIGTLLRLFIGDVFANTKVDRLIYLDADTIVNMDIMCLWNEEISQSGLSAAPDAVIQKVHNNIIKRGLVKAEHYFNAGVLLINIRDFKDISTLIEQNKDFFTTENLEYLDQDILNYFYPDSCSLPVKYNTFVPVKRGENIVGIEPAIYHYVNNCIDINMNDPYNSLYYDYFLKTPWSNAGFIGGLINNIVSVYINYYEEKINKQKNALLKCVGKRRLAIGYEKDKRYVTGKLMLKGDDKYISLDNNDSGGLDINIDRDILLIFLDENDYDRMKKRLEPLGCYENEHFFKGGDLLPETNQEACIIDGYKAFLLS